MKTAYRIEYPDGKGMYHCVNGEWVASKIMGNDKYRHPLPEDDSKLCEERDFRNILCLTPYKFAFESVKQLRNWIYQDDWLQSLHNCGMLISEYTCQDEDVLVGNTQAIFKNEISRIQYNILEYFKLTENIG